MSSHRGPLVLILASALASAWLIGPATAPAAQTVTISPDSAGNAQLVINGDSSDEKLTFSTSADGSQVTIVGFFKGTPPSGCTRIDTKTIRCATASFDSVAIDLGAGDDTVSVDPAFPNAKPVSATLGDGRDTFTGGGEADSCDLGAGPNVCTTNGGNDTCIGGSGRDHCDMGQGSDICLGLQDNDRCSAGPGNDRCSQASGNDLCFMGAGNDICRLGSGNDQCSLGPGRDVCIGGTGNDICRGGPGADLLRGGPGTDQLIAGGGRDTCSQGPGRGPLSSCEVITR